MALHTISVKGREKTWSFTIDVDPKYLPEWEADGLEIYELCNTIPQWVADRGYLANRVWCFCQDFLTFKWIPRIGRSK